MTTPNEKTVDISSYAESFHSRLNAVQGDKEAERKEIELTLESIQDTFQQSALEEKKELAQNAYSVLSFLYYRGYIAYEKQGCPTKEEIDGKLKYFSKALAERHNININENKDMKKEHLTTDPTDPELGRGVDSEPTEQHSKYLVLSEEERSKGFVRPVRRSYIHVGIGGHEIDPNDMSKHGRTGNACGAETRMGLALCETYARDPKFYGSTYCVGCRKHLPVAEFVWAEDGEIVGS